MHEESKDALDLVLKELIAQESSFQWPAPGTNRADLETMIAPEFWETGASGQRYSREVALEVLEKRLAEPQEEAWESTDSQCQRLAEDVYLLTYTLVQASERVTRRATIWRRTAEGWKAAYHQGTLVEGADSRR